MTSQTDTQRSSGRSISLNKLNARQREAVLHGDGPLLVLAGAGSGKTSTMAYRIAHLIGERGVAPSQILGLSFTRKAAGELKERVKKLLVQTLGPGAPTRGLTITTFHSLCAQILRSHADRLGFQKNFTIMDTSDQADVIREALKAIKLDERKFDPDTILFQIGQSKNRFMSPDQAQGYFLETSRMPSDYAIVTASVYERYQQSLKALNAVDFDDLLFHSVDLLEKFDEVRAAYQERFRYILVDEYQDTNPAQFRLLKALTEKRQNICVVGDDDQSIYAWRGADPEHILRFTHDYPAASTITLDQNYRSTSTILNAANEVIKQNKHRHPKTLWSDRGQGEPITQIIVEEDRAEAEAVAEELLRRAKRTVEGREEQIRPWKDFAILYRSNSQSRLFEEALRMRRMPYKIVGGLSFLDRKEVKSLLSYWRVIVNPKDDAAARKVINFPARGVGKGTMETLNQQALQKGTSFLEALGEFARAPSRAQSGALQFLGLVHDLRHELERMPADRELLSQWGKHSVERFGLKKALEDDSDGPAQAARKWENIEELVHSLGQIDVQDMGVEAGENGLTLLREYIARMVLEVMDKEEERDKKDPAKERDQITLLTLHGAKGLEFPIVFLVGLEEGFLPHKRTLEEAQDLGEERRLCYVGITRAKDHLFISLAKNRIRYGKPVPRHPSRFLEEIPKDLKVIQDESLSPTLHTPEAQEEHENKVKNFLAQIRAQITSK